MQENIPSKSVVIFDIDGTLADAEHRRHHLEKTPKDWDSFFAECHLDAGIQPVLELFHLFVALKDVVFFTGRSEEHRQVTVDWLTTHTGINQAWINGRLWMRQNGDRREDSVVKSEMLDQFLKDNPEAKIWAVFDDRHSVCRMWVERGLFVFDVAQGKGHF